MLRLKQISKSFPGVQALEPVVSGSSRRDPRAGRRKRRGQIDAEKVMAGAYQPDEGEISFDGQPCTGTRRRDAKRRGIHVIYQELVLFPQSSVAENIFVGNEPRTCDRHHRPSRGLNRQASEISNELGVAARSARARRKLSCRRSADGRDRDGDGRTTRACSCSTNRRP